MIASAPSTLITLSYNSRRQRSTLSDPNYGLMQTTYNAFNELVSETNAKNQTTTYDSYDALSRLLQKTYPNGQLTTYSYDTKKTGLPDWTEGPGHKVEYTYDDMLRVETITETINDQSYTTSHTYDELGRLSNLVYPGGYPLLAPICNRCPP